MNRAGLYGMALLMVSSAACVGMEEPTEATSTATSALSQFGHPMYARINSQENPNKPEKTEKQHKQDKIEIHSIPTFDSSFTTDGVVYPYTMVGKAPQKGGTTVVATEIIPTRFTFADGTVLDGSDSVAATLASPIFSDATYSTGTTQFGDAIQRATFWNTMKSNYHVRLGEHPVVRPALSATIPADKGFAIPVGPGQSLALIDIDYFYQLMRDQLGPKWNIEKFPIVLSHNVFLYIGDASQCCVLGFHDAYVTKANNKQTEFDVQTWAWASYSDPGFFSVPISDVHALSHEVAEWMNDPFTFNPAPAWQGNDSYGCNTALEVGDPIVGSAFPVTINGRTYNPQNEALLPWFSRQTPSTAFAHAYSYPDTSVLTTYSSSCTP